jgi:hypothetical protein
MFKEQFWSGKPGKVILMGDAAHATYPFNSQGASMAVEDGAALGGCIQRVNRCVSYPTAGPLLSQIKHSLTCMLQCRSLKQLIFTKEFTRGSV